MTWPLVLSAWLVTFVAIWWVLDRPPVLKQRVIVNFKSNPEVSLSGVLWASRGPWLILKQVTALRSDGKQSPVDGDAVVPRDDVQFIQVPPGA